MLDFTTKFGRRVNRRLRQERIIWLTTVDSKGVPQPVPIWFHWDGKTILVFSERNKPKLQNIARNPRVVFNLNCDEHGGDVAVIHCEAEVLEKLPQPGRMQTFLRKYKQGIKDIGKTEQGFKDAYSVPILFTPKAMRGF